MAKLQDHARIALFIDQVYHVESTSLTLSVDGGQQDVDLMNEGLAGFTPGSGRVTINGGYAIPVGGQEFDFLSASALGTYHTLQVPIGKKWYRGRGKFKTSDVSQSAGANTEGNFSWTGELKPLE